METFSQEGDEFLNQYSMAKRKVEEVAQSTKKPTKSLPEVQYSLCIPSSIISSSNAKNLNQITQIAYQVARTATLFSVGEIVVLETPSKEQKASEIEAANQAEIVVSTSTGAKKKTFNLDVETPTNNQIGNDSEKVDEEVDQTTSELKPTNTDRKDNQSNGLLFATLLQYFITPPYLRKALFADSPYNKKFKYCDQLPTLSSLPFMCNNEVWKDFREGLTIPKHTPKVNTKNGKKSPKSKLKTTKYVNIGGEEAFELKKEVPVNVRVTVDLKNKVIVSPEQAYGVIGRKSSFGYMVRVAKSFSSIFTECPIADGYTQSIFVKANSYYDEQKQQKDLPEFNKEKYYKKGGNVLLVLGNWEELNYVFSKENLQEIENVSQMFDVQLQIPNGSRIEDAAMISLSRVYM